MTLNIEQVLEGRDKAEAMLAEARKSFEDEAAKYRKIIAGCDAWLWKNGEHTADSLTEEFVALRDARSDLKQAYDNDDEALKAQMKLRTDMLREMLDKMGAKSFRTDHGTAFKTVKTRANCGDWPTFWEYLWENKRFDMLEKRVSQKPITDMLDDNGQIKTDADGNPLYELPPGINLYQETEITVRRS